jgi:hypothetical protein
LCGTRKINTTPYHPQTDGLVERFNKTLATILSMYVNRKHTDWDKFLPYAVFAYNTARQQSTQFSPFFLLHGRNAKLPVDAALNFDPSRYTIDVDNYANEVQRLFTVAWDIARQNIIKAQDQQKAQYDKKAHNLFLEIGDQVYKYNPIPKASQTQNFLHPWHGPYVVIEQKYPNVKIQLCNNKKNMRGEWIHVNLLKPCKTGQRCSKEGIPTCKKEEDKNTPSIAHTTPPQDSFGNGNQTHPTDVVLQNNGSEVIGTKR